MTPPTSETRAAILAATVTAASSVAFQVSGKATRDALFIATYGSKGLPLMVMATAVLAFIFVLLSSRALSAWGPGRVVPIGFGISAGLILVEWVVSFWRPGFAAILFYLHCSCLGGLLISGFWSLINERFDPRTAKLELGPITAWGTLGGALGAAIAARVATARMGLPATAMLPILALLHFVAAVSVARVRVGTELLRRPAVERPEDPARSVKPGLQALAGSPYLRGLVGMVLLISVSEGLIDLAFKNRANAAMADSNELLRFFAVFYGVIALITLLIQMTAGRVALTRLGPARTAALLPAGVTAASAGALAFPGLGSAVIARAAESSLQNSVFRGGYEVLFTPVSSRSKRAVKPLADVGAARVGDLVAAGMAQGAMAVTLVHAPIVMTALALLVAIAAAWLAIRLNAGYVRSLESGLRSRAIELDLSEVRDAMTRSIMMKTLGPLELSRILPATARSGSFSAASLVLDPTDPWAARVTDLRSNDPARVRRGLRQGPITEPLAPEVIALLARDEVAREVIECLRQAGPVTVGPLVAGLLNPEEEFAIRRRIPLVLATFPHPRAVEGMSHGLADRRFEVRYRCGRGLSHLTEIDSQCRVEIRIVYDAVLREVEVGAGVWEGRRLLDRMDDETWSPVVDDAIRERADRSLEHVFTLLALVMPRQALRIAFRGLHVDDPYLRGTALEYLESALPPEIRKPLWPFLEDRRPGRAPAAKPTEEALAKLLHANESIVIRLDELRKREG